MSKKENIADINLALNDVDNVVMSDLQKDMLKEELSELPPLKKGQVSLNGVYTFDAGDKLEVSFYIRNGLKSKVSLDIVPLVLQNKKGDILGKQIVDMKAIGIIPPLGARPCKVYFRKENIFVDNIPSDDWEIKFESQIKALKTKKVELEEVSENFPPEMLSDINDFMNRLPLIEEGEVDFSTVGLLRNTQNSISIIILIRNGSNNIIKVQKLPITIKDEKGELVGGGVFTIENIEVNASKARVYNFVLKSDKIINKDVDLSKCKVYFER